jgi:5'-methylthioadenosine phosphorylase
MMIGVIGGSGLYDLEGIEGLEERQVPTAMGKPSDALVCGRLHGVDVCFLPRHGRGHRLMPSEINHRANILAMKILGVDRVVSISAVGSLRENMRPRDIVLPDQYYDRTKRSAEHTFFGGGIVAHVGFGEPACVELRRIIAVSARLVARRDAPDTHVHESGTYVNMEGPAFSTRAESAEYRRAGFDIIGMTSLAEAKLCREAEICYQSMSMVTDYDCWRQTEEPVTVEALLGHLHANTALAKAVLRDLLPRLAAERSCGCRSALAGAIITDPKAIPAETRERLRPLIGKYVG